MIPVARLTDQHSCPIPGHGVTPIASSSTDILFNMLGAARVGDVCGCGAVITVGFPSVSVNYRPLAHLGSPTSHGGSVISGSPDSYGGNSGGGFAFSGTGPIVDFAKLGAFNSDGTINDAAMQRLLDDPNIEERARQAGALVSPDSAAVEDGSRCVFAKTCTVPPESTEAGTLIEPVANFGQAVVMGSTAIVSTEGGATLGRVAGQAALETLGTWSLRGAAAAAGTAASTLLLALWSTSMGTSTLTEEQLRGMMVAPTRVRFQFRRDAEGIMRVYGIHTSATSGMDSVPVVSQWSQVGSAMEAKLNGVTIIWTPNNGPVVQAPTTYPGVTDALENIMVHPVAEGTDSQIEIYPASDDLTWQDCILVFPVGSGVPPLYLVFAKPMVNPLEVDIYGAFSGRPRNGLHVDHMPSQAATRRYLEANLVNLTQKQVDDYLNKVASVAIPAKVHQKFSETYGRRNSRVKQHLDAGDLRGAVESNFDAIKPYMLEEGFTEADLEVARAQMHQINEEQGWY